MVASDQNAFDDLVAILQLAYSGELAAGYAYRGHWRSVRGEDSAHIKEIENEEWHHRELVGEMLQSLGARPNDSREIRAHVIGRTLGFLCHLTGWLTPMYGAGRLESRNIVSMRRQRDMRERAVVRISFIVCSQWPKWSGNISTFAHAYSRISWPKDFRCGLKLAKRNDPAGLRGKAASARNR
jgi:hypothetical protein